MLALAFVVVSAPAPVDRSPADAVLSVPSQYVPPDMSTRSAPSATAAAPVPATSAGAGAPASISRATRLREKFDFFPYGWVRTDATYYSAAREGYSNLSLGGARIGGGVTVGPVTAFVTLEAAAAKGPQLFDAFVLWDIVPRLSLRAGQFKAPFGYRFNAPDLVDELPRAPLSMQATTPGRQVGIELSYDFWRYAQVFAAVFSGIGQNRDANNTKIAFAGKLLVRPMAFAPRLPQLILVGSVFTYSKTNGFTPTLNTAFGFEFIHGIPANGAARRVAAGGGLFWRFLSARGEFFHASDGRQRDTDGDPFTRGEPLPPMIGAGGYAQLGVVVTGQTKDSATLLPRLTSARVRDSAVELSARYERMRVGARDVVGNGVQTASAGVNWILLHHLRIFAAASWQRLDVAVPEVPSATSWGVAGGIAGYFLGRAGRGD